MGINLLHRKERLILTTIDIIDELGIQKLTTREIAKRQGVSEATIFRHFENKNELLLAVLDYFTQFDADMLQTTKLRNFKPLEALQYLITSYAEYYENYPAITSILQLFDVLRYEPDLSEKVIKIQTDRTAMFSHLVKEAMNAGEISKEVDCDTMAVMILGLFRELCFNWKISNCSFSLKERSQVALKMLLDAFHTNTNVP
ncbi:MAG TPA: TetR/AcrR family transcriptional regulator [Mobilitalea sp.]|nr:TetR/AcrR family transcriptional regulator [Mobilitalea sp.]